MKKAKPKDAEPGVFMDPLRKQIDRLQEKLAKLVGIEEEKAKDKLKQLEITNKKTAGNQPAE
jgi:hypothetical protein